jgi:hypothetical protein
MCVLVLIDACSSMRTHSVLSVQPPAPKVVDTSYMSLPIRGLANDTVVKAQCGAPHGRHSSYAAAPYVLTDVTVKHGAVLRKYGGSTQVWADELT